MDARYFPGMRRRVGGNYKQKYTMVLCDVPCSGDRTSRKNNNVFSSWSIAQAMSLHKLQRKILRRAMELLPPGGTVVCSTCSLNPLENEAVVASVIEDVGGVEAMEIKAKGLSKDDEAATVGTMYERFDDVPEEQKGNGKSSGKGCYLCPSMFPPSNDAGFELAKQLNHCGRFLLNDMLDSGGFFVACIQRLQAGELTQTTTMTETVKEPKPVDTLHETIKKVRTQPTEEEQQLREGDWICYKCKTTNFGQRDRNCCFACKARKPRPVERKETEDSITKSKEQSEGMQPLLHRMQPKSDNTTLDSFLDFF
eukprot:scaffold1532_cov193-Alexandrium_tamarense.AAC.3